MAACSSLLYVSFRTSDSRASFAVLPAQDTTPMTAQENVAKIRRRHKKVTRDRQRNQNVPLPDGRTGAKVDHLLPAVEFLPLLSISDKCEFVCEWQAH